MATTLFSDEIVNPTDLRKNQKRWLDMAAVSPISIAYGKYNLAIYNREKIADIFRANYYLELAIKLCTSVYLNERIDVLPWVEYLDAADRVEFFHDFATCLLMSMTTGDWGKAENVLDDWKATAETLSNKKASEALKSRAHSKANYIELK